LMALRLKRLCKILDIFSNKEIRFIYLRLTASCGYNVAHST
jgi:hypothetical protein